VTASASTVIGERAAIRDQDRVRVDQPTEP
jgi:hypothetical protein